ncbi:MAG: DNA replication/repair protein RecF [Selenomonadaceae bacterium]|nr:DNA replication/repair protein RecF [Selenomonadaceae bacterium]
MNIKKIYLTNFRNYSSLELKLNNGVNIFLGENGAGKTNILEALSLASVTVSYRTRTDSDLIKWENDSAEIRVEYERYGVTSEIKLILHKRGRKEIFVNSNKSSAKEIVGNLTTVVFSPEDLMLVKGAPSLRRSFIDREISQASPFYMDNLMRYNKVLKERNSLLKQLKEGGSRELLDIYDMQLARYAAFVAAKRIEAVGRLDKIAKAIGVEISSNKESFGLQYSLSGVENISEEYYLKKLKEMRERDIMRGSTGVGPHLDDLIFTINENELKKYGSQGQQRTAVLGMKLSEVIFLKEEKDEYPLLLLDDVLSELDEYRRNALVKYLKNENITTVLTATDDSYIPKDMGRIYTVGNGEVSSKETL